MIEHGRSTQTIEKPTHDTSALLEEMTRDFGSAQTEFVKSLNELLENDVAYELEQLGEERAEKESLQDKYKLPFSPEKCIPKLSDVAMIMTSLDIARNMLTRESTAVVDGESEERKMKKEQMDKEFDDAVAEKRSRAEGIIRTFLNGNADPSTLASAGLPQEWVEALTARGRARLDEYGGIDAIPADEMYGMINVCAIGLVKAERGIEFGNHQ